MADAAALTNPNTNPIILDSRGEAILVLTGATDLKLTDAEDTLIWTAPDVDKITDALVSASGTNILGYADAGSSVNYFQMTNASTGNSPILETVGTDSNPGMKVRSKGSGALLLDGGSTGAVEINSVGTGDINLRRNSKVWGTATVTGATILDSTLQVTGFSSFNAASTFNSAVAFNDTFNLLPAGLMMMSASADAMSGWLECNGQAVSRTTYAALFTAIGGTYGVGDGSTTFNVPNMSRRVPVGRGGSGSGTLGATLANTGGAETHTLITSEMPAHTHTFQDPNAAGAAATSGGVSVVQGESTQNTSSTGGGGAHNNMQPSMVLIYMIKT